MRRRWWHRARLWFTVSRWCPECERNGIERAEAVNQVIYWRGLYDDASIVSYARAVLVDRLVRAGIEAGLWHRLDLAGMATEIEEADTAGGAPNQKIRVEAANLLRLAASIAPMPNTAWECRACGGTTRAVHEDQSVSCDDCGRFEHETGHKPTAEGE